MPPGPECGKVLGKRAGALGKRAGALGKRAGALGKRKEVGMRGIMATESTAGCCGPLFHAYTHTQPISTIFDCLPILYYLLFCF
jgi:hypothetical protein